MSDAGNHEATGPSMKDRAEALFRDLQQRICQRLAALETSGKSFSIDSWERPGGGGGISRVLEGGEVFERAGVNFSLVHGDMRAELAAQLPGEGSGFVATGVSLVIHPRSPRVPTTHANVRYLQRGSVGWFGGGADLTPYYLEEDDARHFHGALKAACDRFDPAYYPKFKAWCDDYFFLKHRKETRGVGGIFFDYLQSDLARHLDLVGAVGEAFLDAYVPIVERRRDQPYGEAERSWQLLRRGRYVEFNLVYDRGTQFGLMTDGRAESILMSMPPLCRWAYDVRPAEGSPEAALLDVLRTPRAWV
jgi:coproporphyrinogen III oxidase